MEIEIKEKIDTLEINKSCKKELHGWWRKY